MLVVPVFCKAVGKLPGGCQQKKGRDKALEGLIRIVQDLGAARHNRF